MSVTYRFPNLQALADHFEIQAQRQRANAQATIGKRGHRTRRLTYNAEAATLEGVADMLRNTILEERKPQ